MFEDNWNSPTLGAFGNGWEVTCNGCEILQVTYFQKMGDKKCPLLPLELAYGIERLSLCLQEKENFSHLLWKINSGTEHLRQL